jgi:hypothetical protein
MITLETTGLKTVMVEMMIDSGDGNDETVETTHKVMVMVEMIL